MKTSVNMFYARTRELAHRLALLSQAYFESYPVTRNSLLFGLAGLLVTLALLVMDDRQLVGEPIWLKPAKFFASTVVFNLSLPFLLELRRTVYPRIIRGVEWVTAGGFFIELVLISMQAARGVRSHFNFTTSFDGAVFITMAAVIFTVWFSHLVLFFAYFLGSKVASPSLWVARWGLGLFLAGAMTGQFLARPTAAQQQLLQAGVPMHPGIIGGHTVGGDDGSVEKLPVTGWVKYYGDLRIPHFMGMHALQAMFLVTFIFGNKLRTASIHLFGGGLALFFLASLHEAFSGYGLFVPSPVGVFLYASGFVFIVGSWLPSALFARRLRDKIKA